MIIDLKNTKETVLPNFKGGEKEMVARMFSDEDNKIFTAYLEPGASIGEHEHNGTTEIIFFTSGKGKGTVDGVESVLKPGTVQYCHSGHSHSIENNGSERLEFAAVVCRQE